MRVRRVFARLVFSLLAAGAMDGAVLAQPQLAAEPSSTSSTTQDVSVATEQADRPVEAAVLPASATEITAAPVDPAANPASTPPARNSEPAAPAAAKPPPPPPPPLDVQTLEKRLRETKAIGVFTKLTLKNQVDDLLDRVRAMHERKSTANVMQLRQAYDLLIMKVLSLLQDSDPPLAKNIVASREPLWAMLMDPVKFSTIT